MNLDMGKNARVWLMLAIVVAVALLSGFWTTTYPLVHPRPPFTPRPPMPVPGDIELYYSAKTVVSTVNLTLLVFLLIVYVDLYRKTQSEFTIGLIVFSLVLLFYALTANPLMQWIFGFYGSGLGPFAMIPDLFTCAALAVLSYLTLKY